MLNYTNLNNEQIKSLSSFLFDVAKAGIIDIFAFGTFSNNDVSIKIFFTVANLALAFLCIETAMTLLKKIA